MERYAEHKESDLSYLPKLPVHWKRTALKRVLSTPITDGPHETPELLDDGIPFLSAEAVKNLTLDFDLKRGYISEDDHKRFCQKCKPEYGDIFMVKSGATTGNIAMVTTHEEFSVWSPLALIRSDEKKIHNEFLFLLLQSPDFRMQVELFWSYGTQQNIGMMVLGNQYVFLPALDEQQAIVRHFVPRIAKIDEVLTDLARQAEMLDTYKRELIAEAVTKGLDKSAAMKHSGVDWIGAVPAHWGTTKIKWMFEIVKRIYGKEDRDVLSITQRGIKVKDIESNAGQLAESYANYQIVNVNDFAMNSMDLLTGWVDCSPFEGVTSPDYRVFRFSPGKEQCHGYYKYLFQMCYKNRIFYRLGQGVSNLGRWRLQADQFLNMRLPQPTVAEQGRIASYLDEKTAKIEGLITDIMAQIEKLKQYRQIVIHDAVTGKIKVTEG